MPADLTREEIAFLRTYGPQSPVMRRALDAAEAEPSAPVAEPGDWTVSDTELARDILCYLGIGSDASLEPGDRRRDRIAAMICADRERRIVKPATRITALEAENAALKAKNEKFLEAAKDTLAHLVAAHSLLSRTPRAKKAAPSNTMFDMMLRDYEASIERARALLQGGSDAG